jgi:hypothetical protein
MMHPSTNTNNTLNNNAGFRTQKSTTTMKKKTPPDDKESTPLLFSPKGGGRLDPNREISSEEGPTRRRVGQHQVRWTHFESSFEDAVFVNATKVTNCIIIGTDVINLFFLILLPADGHPSFC